MEEIKEKALVPGWLEPLLMSAFFSVCRTHGDSTRSECNMFCIDCAGHAFCYYCRSARHLDHRVIQIRRSSYHDVVRVAEIEDVLDISGVQTYVINSARVLFLNERPQPRTGKGVAAHSCEICGRTLLDPFRFCSLGCKLVGIRKKGDASFVVEGRNNGKEMMRRRQGEGNSETVHQGEEEEQLMRQGMGHQQDCMYPPPTPSPPSSARRRKGIPHRAPFGS